MFKFCASCGLPLAKAAAPAPTPAPAPEAAGPTTPVLLTVLRADGSEAGSFEVPAGVTTVGRDTGAIFGGDNYLSPQHAMLTRKGSKFFVKDIGTTNGTYLRLKREAPEPLINGQMFRIGQEILRFEALAPMPPVDGVEHMGGPSAGYIGRVAMVTSRDATGNAFPIPETGVHIGRERGHILFPEDGYVSGLHCSLTHQDNALTLTDLGSSNGTFVRLNEERELHDGDVLLMGQQLFRVAM
jgi:pSer/pThr/pTyr-binding forkhead associated (FHA) protein